MGVVMLGDFPLNPILPAQDGDRARAFYRDVLGLELLSGPTDDPMRFRAGAATTIVLTEVSDRIPPPFPVVSFMVRNIEELVNDLLARGSVFEELPSTARFAGQMGAREGVIMDFGSVKSAFLRDSEGNLLALNEILRVG
jgi:catechol 2,3-dioxygenase-like lactoylglutathione lyase family enzyme